MVIYILFGWSFVSPYTSHPQQDMRTGKSPVFLISMRGKERRESGKNSLRRSWCENNKKMSDSGNFSNK